MTTITVSGRSITVERARELIREDNRRIAAGRRLGPNTGLYGCERDALLHALAAVTNGE